MKKTLALILSVLMLVSCLPAGAITLETVESATEVADVAEVEVAEDAALAATFTATPGLNIVNNKAEVENFDGVTSIDELNVTTGGTSASDTDPKHDIRLNPTAGEENTTDKVLFLNVYTKTETYPHVYVPATVEKDRQYYTKLTIYETAATGGKCLWLMNDADGSVWKTPSGYNRQTWYTYSATVTAPADMTKFNYQVKIGDKSQPAELRSAFYVNELAFVPYYKITYTGADTDQVLFADENDKDMSKLMTTYTVKSDNYLDTIDNGDGTLTVCVGWSLTEGGEAVTSVPLANADITLYPVWETTEYLSASKTYMSGNAGTTFEVVANGEATDWSYDAGNTEATVDFSDPTKAVITAAGYPGYVTVYATVNGVKSNKEIRLIGGEYRKPGLNTLTGTTGVEDYENVEPQGIQTTNAFIGLGLDGVNAGSIAENTLGFSGNDSNHVVVTTNYNTNNLYPKIVSRYNVESGRPVQYMAKIVAGYSSSVLMWLQGDGSQGIGGSIQTASKANKWYNASYKYAPTDVSKGMVFFQGKYDGEGASDRRSFYWDDVAFVPYYKVTYYGLDGETVVDTKYTLLDEGGNLATKYAPDNSVVEGATGYATTKGGNKVPYVALAYEDIELYAVDTATAFFVSGNNYVEVVLTDAEYTIPSSVEGLTLTNLKAWTDGTVFYLPGEKVTGTDLVGKTLKAVCFEAPLFDREKGELAYLVNYENTADGATNEWVKNKADYLNTKYVANLTNRMDAVVSGYVATVGGRKVLKNEIAGTSTVFLTGYGFGYDEDTVRGKITIDFDYMFGTDASKFSLNGVRMWRGLNGINADNSLLSNGDTTKGNGYVWASPKPAFSKDAVNTWYHLTAKKTDTATEKNGLKGATAQINLTKTDTTKIIYFDNFSAYIFPGDKIYFESEYGKADYVSVPYDLSGTFTFPAAEAVFGEVPAGFIGWTDGTSSYNAGQTVTEEKVMYKVFYPICTEQSADAPAMGFAWDGDTIPGLPCGVPQYMENIEDDGRNALHIAYWQAEKKDFRNDARLSVKTSNHYDPAEYGLLQYSVKVSEAYTTADKGATYKTASTSGLAFYAHTKADGTYTSPVVLLSDSEKVTVGNNYNRGVIDMSGNEKWLANGGYGFCVDYLKLQSGSNATFGGDIYLDYVRVYRNGLANVAYDTNAPEGATIVSEVAAETGRGLGTGYLLTNDRPEVNGYVFLGWAETPDATAADVVTSVTVDVACKTVYAVWASDEEGTLYAGPTVNDTIGFRNDIDGIRFTAGVTSANKSTLNEYGMLIARADVVSADELTFGSKDITATSTAKAPLYVVGTAYKKGEKDKYYDKDETTGDVTYSIVCVNIPEENHDTELIAKAYAKYLVNGREITVYGNYKTSSYNEAASGEYMPV